MTLSRRGFLGGTTAAALASPHVLAQGASKPKVVVIGGGAGGATAARYLAIDSEGALDVTLIEPSRAYYSCFFSNLYLGGFKSLDDIAHSYGTLASTYGINVVHDWAVGVDRAAKTVTLASGTSFAYDKLIVSPGIDFVNGSVEGWSIAAQNKMPHAYKAGSQTELLKAQIAEMPQGGIYAMIAPPNPYRCPPGPYERISMVAHVLKETNPSAKILIADPKEKFSKMALFEEGWATHYPGMIDWIGPDFGGDQVSVDPNAMTITIDGEEVSVDVCNVIPAMKAGHIAESAGLTDGRWAPVRPRDMSSLFDPNIHVLGDASQQGDMPKSAYSANSQAKVCAAHVLAELTDAPLFAPTYTNTCWSLIAVDDGVKVGASYEPTGEKISRVDGFISQTGEAPETRQKTYLESESWYLGITLDMFS